MEIFRTIMIIVFIAVCVLLTVVILKQEGKGNGLGAIAGASDTYWSRNKGRSEEGMLVKFTRILVILFLAIAAFLGIARFM